MNVHYLYDVGDEYPAKLKDMNMHIDYLDDNELRARYARIKPLVEIDGVIYTLREFTTDELSGMAYTWHKHEDKREIIPEEDLESVDDIVCLHTWTYYGMFKPSVHEVLAQIPEVYLDKIDYFQIVEAPKTRHDVFKYPQIIDAGYHASTVRLYKKKEKSNSDAKCPWILYDYRTICPKYHNENTGLTHSPYWRIPEFYKVDIKYCPYCGKEIDYSEIDADIAERKKND